MPCKDTDTERWSYETYWGDTIKNKIFHQLRNPLHKGSREII